jgi:arylsulfatase A-like enzyme
MSPAPALASDSYPWHCTLMIRHTTVSHEVATTCLTLSDREASRPGLTSILFLSIWCGLVAGLLEVGTIVLSKYTVDPNHLYGMSRHFVWLIPLTNLGVFLAGGLIGGVVSLAWPSRGPRLVATVFCGLALLPMLLVFFPRVYGLAWLVAALGAGSRLVPSFERNAGMFRRLAWSSFLLALLTVAILAASPWVDDRRKQSRENARALPRSGSPNVLLIVMDTVAAGHLNLYGGNRATSTTLIELAERGIRFDSAQAAASWTLPSHATIFTGRWMHELSVGWLTPLDNTHPTLAEFLSARGYATAGFVANSTYAGSDSGLGRGFTQYQDYSFPGLTALKTAVLVDRVMLGIQSIADFLEDRQELIRWRPFVQHVLGLFLSDRKPAATVNRELLDWLTQRAQPERPFFVFLNYMDAHYPYFLPPGRLHRFGGAPTDKGQRTMIRNWADLDKSLLSPQDLAFAGNAYDDCIADLDEQVGKLLDKLRRRAVLEHTWLIVVSDHGESFGEHTGIFCHGSSLYQSELHVPLLIIPPGGQATKQVVKDTVSLRDLPATIVDVLGLRAGSPFPGNSFSRFWSGASETAPHQPSSSDPALAEVVPDDPHNRDSSGLPKKNWPLGALIDGEWSYIRREGDIREELFHLREDASEQHNLASDPAARSTVERKRSALGQFTGGPLSPQRFNR